MCKTKKEHAVGEKCETKSRGTPRWSKKPIFTSFEDIKIVNFLPLIFWEICTYNEMKKIRMTKKYRKERHTALCVEV